MSAAEVENEVKIDDGDKVEKQKKLSELISEGKKLLIAGNKDLAIDRLSDAAELGVLLYGELGPDMFNVYLNYGRAQLEYANDLMLLVNQKTNDEAESSDEEGGEENGQATKQTGDDEKEAEEEEEEEKQPEEDKLPEEDTTSEPAPADENNENGEEQPLDALGDMSKGAWDVLEIARRIAENQLTRDLPAEELKEWRLRKADANFYISQVLLVDEEFDRAWEELRAALDMKADLLPPYDRQLAEIHFQLGRVHNLREDYAESAESYQSAAEVFQKRIAHLQETKTDETAKAVEAELNELEDLCRELAVQIQDAKESQKLNETIKEQLREKLLGHAAEPKPAAEPANDITDLIRKRKRPQTEEEGAGDAQQQKKPKED